ncbi:Activator of Hsp90 ATPase homolog 1-like protein [Bordetella pertussis]|uniref:Activator of Hsp90 ATPase homologue 1/2-like C-terminal domain-containing protein n=5 Tax=Bordetella TaxID=517 RepID=Q7VTQ0_BORPE|nr:MULTISPECIES: SRPBCC family protein [Bordetella]ETH41188.1 hypothetical protein L547_0833 [Bordetella pertussis H918]ETH43345.1 hypothetical protein L549_0759 [Bordetella pertussis H939]ETH49362.1 hypothetical protein L548_0487 [Bordetella pertussis H921]ETH70252.1 hypothetical protein L545_2928 [Bordetella pertussis STO1-CHLA-0011]ETH82169.1 hypothetical protein L559_0713 [Bordetella pertussis STO1-CHOC-0017]ETH85096.1 hypothetical protein L560_0705 [Bordetella pertussis STO1-CHOC-0018]E
MTRQHSTQPDPKLDLVLERTIDVPPALVWQAWTQPEHIKHWLTPAPWQTVRCDVDLRPGGRFRFVMRSPEGEEHTHDCCYLEIVEGSRLVWTNALLPGFRPAGGGGDVPAFTAVIRIEPHDQGTRYTATAMHGTQAGCRQHSDMGFHDGWGAALDQLVAHARNMQQAS